MAASLVRAGTVEVYNWHSSVTPSADYGVRVRPVGSSTWQDVRAINRTSYYTRGAYAPFGCSGDVEVRVTNKTAVTSVKVLPSRLGISAQIDPGNNRVFTFAFSGPRNLAVEVNGVTTNWLYVFANPLATDKPSPTDPSVWYLAAGQVHTYGIIKIKPNGVITDANDNVLATGKSSIYVEGGAMFKGAIKANSGTVNNFKIHGYGVLYNNVSGSQSIHTTSQTGWTCKGFIVDNREGLQWTWLDQKSTGYTIDNVKIFSGAKNINNDGLDLCGTTSSTVKNCFFDCNDDNISLKASTQGGSAPKNILITRNVFATQARRAFGIGGETDWKPDQPTNLRMIDNDIIRPMGQHLFMISVGYESLLNGFTCENLYIENCHDRGQFDAALFWIRAFASIGGQTTKGNIRNVWLKNIRVSGSNLFPSRFDGGLDAAHTSQTFVDGYFFNDSRKENMTDANFTKGTLATVIFTNTTTVPGVPTGLSATTVSSGQIDLRWTDGANEAGYQIRRKTGSGGTYATIATLDGNTTSFKNFGLAPNTTYFYQVRAINAAGNSAWSSEVSATTSGGGGTPAAPSGLTATAVSSSQINLSWTDNATNETGFKIERKTGAGGTWAQIATVGVNATSYSNTGLTPNTTYYYRVAATNSAGSSAWSNEANATTFALTPPAAPSSLAATAVSSNQINLAWTDNATNETGFKIERKTGAGGTWAQIATVGVNATSYTNTGLTPNTAYYYRVAATNSAGSSAWSNEANATTPGTTPSAKPIAPDDPLVPAGLGVGATFHLAFVTSTTRDATSTNIADYDAFVQNAANNAGSVVSNRFIWRAIGSTAAVDAKSNAVVLGPVYRLDGVLLATNFADLWDGRIAANFDVTEKKTSVAGRVWTGTQQADGSKSARPLGYGAIPTDTVSYGARRNLTQWLRESDVARTNLYSLYALSELLIVVATNSAGASGWSNEANATTSTPVAAQFTGWSWQPAGGLLLSATGGVNQVYILQGATNLLPPVSWQPIATNTASGGAVQFLDSGATNHPQRYYRAVTP